MISSSTSAKRSVAWRNSPLHRPPVRVPESRLSNLRVDLRLETPSDRQSIVVANACAARLFHTVRSQ